MSVASFASKESGMTSAVERFDIEFLLRPSTSTLGALKHIRHDRNAAISDMKGLAPFVAYECATAARMAGSAWRPPVT